MNTQEFTYLKTSLNKVYRISWTYDVEAETIIATSQTETTNGKISDYTWNIYPNITEKEMIAMQKDLYRKGFSLQ
jgi:hypothetical protein